MIDADVGSSKHCSVSNMPSVRGCRGGFPMAAWAIGGGPFIFPETIGYPIGGQNNTRYAIMEVHYDNPDQLATLSDNSGIRYTVTPTMRPKEAGIYAQGYVVDPSYTIPPGQSDAVITAVCPAKCTQASFPPTGINVIATLLHAHTAGKAISVQHFRNGAEQKPILVDSSYDFNFQDFEMRQQELVIMPGDELVTTCHYDTSARTQPTKMDEGTADEMCLSYHVYYPRMDGPPTCYYQNATMLNPQWLPGVGCGRTSIYPAYQTPVTQTYVPPACNRVAPDPARQNPKFLPASTAFFPSSYERSEVLDDMTGSKYKLYWSLDRVNNIIKFAVDVATQGWVALGISPKGGMEGADILIGWVNNGMVYFSDRFASEKGLPDKDQLQDYFDISGFEPGSNTNPPGPNDNPLNIGLVVGLSVVCVALLGAIFLVVRYYRSKRKRDYETLKEFSNIEA